jgi:hypothetical protein
MLSFSRYTNDPETGARELASLLTDVKIFTGVHPGDLYGILIEHFGRREKYKQVKLKLKNFFLSILSLFQNRRQCYLMN